MRPMVLTPLAACVLALVLLAAPALASAAVIHLRSGTVLFGEVVSADENRFQFRRWDNGGVVDLAWTNLVPADAARLQALHRGEIIEDEMIDAARLTLKDGSEVVGKIVEERADRVRIQVGLQDTRTLVPTTIVKRETARIKALQLASVQDLYDAQVRKTDLKSAAAQLDLGLFCLRLRNYDKAKEHLQKAGELDPALKERADAKIALGERERAEEGARLLLERIEKSIATQKFDDARAAVAKLKESFPLARAARGAADLEARIAAEEKSFVTDRKQFMDNKLLNDWWETARTSLRKAAATRELDLGKAKEYVDKVLGGEVKDLLVKRMAIEAKDFDDRWAQRKPSVTKTANYGEGSWIVDSGTGKKAPGTDAKNLDDFLNQGDIDKLINDLRVKEKKDAKTAAEDWWKAASNDKRQAWLEAYAAERLCKTTEVKTPPCAACSGKGLTGGNTELCHRCLGARHDRIVNFQ